MCQYLPIFMFVPSIVYYGQWQLLASVKTCLIALNPDQVISHGHRQSGNPAKMQPFKTGQTISLISAQMNCKSLELSIMKIFTYLFSHLVTMSVRFQVNLVQDHSSESCALRLFSLAASGNDLLGRLNLNLHQLAKILWH